ncbi:AGE family epimerase/isomerase [Niallia sp. NCCP-28]|uniref:AGE family epimerase/isomerase n=1 Tax=Niallia sp. NCCP-28 TaxID=2934712 RepID=UPI0020883DD1|nr:AGE family epimerase/isomerase [Niallia sp. NCCP-28]GKU81887.1 AGE family epimerase/isomerase [Niallia sp. NCCP-28]
MTTKLSHPSFTDPAWVKKHIKDILHFYSPICLDKKMGGYYQCFFDNGYICDKTTKTLVGTSRFIYIFSIGSLLGNSSCISAAQHGLKFLEDCFLDKKHGGFFWSLHGKRVNKPIKLAYGHAFALLAASKAYQSGIHKASGLIAYIYNIIETHFWDEEHQLYIDKFSEDWSKTSPYRGQNANMHMCEALLAAYEATGDKKYLEKAYTIAKRLILEIAPQSSGLIWEHYTDDWTIDWSYKETKNSLKEFRPDGFIPGHTIEWSKLLLMVERHIHEHWLIDKAIQLYNKALSKGWDQQFGGVFFSFAKDGSILDSDKNYWVQAEAIGASILLAEKTDLSLYQANYLHLFHYIWNHFVDHKYGGWYPLLNRQNKRYSNIKSPVNKTDYHPIANCYEAIRALS